METGWFVTANDIKQWTETNKRQAEGLLPLLVRRLIRASCKPDHLHFPSGDSIAIGGWDGTLEVREGNEFVPSSISVWEFGTTGSVNEKFESDFQKRTDNPGDINPSETSFVFVTSRIWKDKDKNVQGKIKNIFGKKLEELMRMIWKTGFNSVQASIDGLLVLLEREQDLYGILSRHGNHGFVVLQLKQLLSLF